MDPTRATITTGEMLANLGLTFLIAVVLTPILRDIFRAYHVVDRPGLRKIHTYPIPRLGGIAIALAYVLGLWRLGISSHLAWMLLPGAAAIFVTGILDDFFNLPPRVKLLGQMGAACLAFGLGLRFPGPTPISFLLTVFWLLLATNSFNLIDGLDGLCTGVGMIGMADLVLLGRMENNLELQVVALPLVGASVGFLCHNFSRATIFLGDSGALLIGFLVGCAGILWSADPGVGGAALGVPLFVACLPVLEVAVSIARRKWNGRPVFSADRGHMHHCLLDRGWAAPKCTLTLYSWAAIGALFALLLAYPPLAPWRIGVILLAVATATAGIRMLGYAELQAAMQLLSQGAFRRAWRNHESKSL